MEDADADFDDADFDDGDDAGDEYVAQRDSDDEAVAPTMTGFKIPITYDRQTSGDPACHFRSTRLQNAAIQKTLVCRMR